MVNLLAESQLPSLQHRVAQLSSSLIAKMAHAPRNNPTPEKVLQATSRNPNLFPRRTWAHDAAVPLTTLNVATTIREKGADIPHPDYTPAPPWDPPLPCIIDDWLPHPKSQYIP